MKTTSEALSPLPFPHPSLSLRSTLSKASRTVIYGYYKISIVLISWQCCCTSIKQILLLTTPESIGDIQLVSILFWELIGGMPISSSLSGTWAHSSIITLLVCLQLIRLYKLQMCTSCQRLEKVQQVYSKIDFDSRRLKTCTQQQDVYHVVTWIK